MSNTSSSVPFLFWGTSAFSVHLLEALHLKYNITPALIVTTPDMPKGRKQILSPSPVKVWAQSHGIELLQPTTLKDEAFISHLRSLPYTLYIVASYGKIIPKTILEIPTLGSINIHPSLLPAYRGPSPIQFQILHDEKNLGTSIILMDEEVDHGPLVAQDSLTPSSWPLAYEEFEKELAEKSAELLSNTLSDFAAGKIIPQVQDEAKVTFTKMVAKSDGEINLNDNAYQNYLKYLAYHEWPGVFFFKSEDNSKIRIVVKSAKYTDGKFIPLRVVPEGKKEMDYSG